MHASLDRCRADQDANHAHPLTDAAAPPVDHLSDDGDNGAAREATTIPASAVARAVGQAVAVAHMAAHSRELLSHTSKAIAGQALAQELQWQQTHLPDRFGEYVYGHAAQHPSHDRHKEPRPDDVSEPA